MEERAEAKKRPSSIDVAKLAGVSRATVSAYINQTRYVSPKLSQKIEHAIKELHYVPDPLARALKMKDAKTVGLVIPVMSRFFAPIITAVNEIAYKNHYGFLLCSSEEDPQRERDVMEILIVKRISGILVVPCSKANAEFLDSIKSNGTPLVQVNRKIEGLPVDSVTSDNFKAAYTATEHLISRGRKNLVFLGFDDNTLSGDQKKAGFEAAGADHDIDRFEIIPVRDHDPENIAESFRDFLSSGKKIDGLILSTQGKTAVGLSVLKERSVRVPDDVAVIGFDDTPWSSLLSPSLTVVSENTREMGEIAVKLLLDRIEGNDHDPPKDIVLEDEFIIRHST
jgi:LacI family transcriptional regulator